MSVEAGLNVDFLDLLSALARARVEFLVVGREAMLRNKRAAGRPKDLVDAAELEKQRSP